MFFIIHFSTLAAQKTIVSGKIFDSETKEPIPYANISYQHSMIGTISEMDGGFFLSTLNPTDSLLITSVGYEVVRKPIKKGIKQDFVIWLKPSSIALEEVVVRPGENPAFRILKEISANKKRNNPDRFKSYQYKSYTKLRLDLNNIDKDLKDQRLLKDFSFVFNYMDSSEVFSKNYLPLLISETVSKFYYSKDPLIKREVIEAFKVSGIKNKTISQFSGKMYQELNIYDNFITFFDPGFVSPIADFGRLYYKYSLEDTAYFDNSRCFKISFKPKRKQERTFYGYFWVADTSFAIKKFQLRVSSDVNLNLLKDMIAINEFSKINDSTWFLTNEDLIIDFNLTNKTYGFFGRKTAVYDSIVINQPLPDSIGNIHTETYVEEKKLDRDSTYWQNSRKAGITEEDKKTYQMVDSVQKVPMYKTIYGLGNMLFAYYIVAGPVEIGPYYTLYSTNPIEGSRIRLGGRTSNQFSTKLMLGGHVAYGFKDERYKYGAYMNYMFNTNPRIDVGTSYYHDIRQLGKSENAFLDDDFLASILRRTINYKLTMVDQYNAFFEREWVQGFSNTIAFKYQTIYSTVYVPFIKVGDTIDQGHITSTEITFSTHFAFHERFLTGKFERSSLGSKYPAIDLDLTYAPKGVINSTYEYFKIQIKISDKIETNPLGYFKFRLTGGKIFGTLPYPLLKLHEGNETYAYDPLAYNMMNYYEFISDEYVSLFAEQHFQGFFLNRIPLIRELHLREVIGGNLLYGKLSDRNKNVMIFPTGLTGLTGFSYPYYEASAGIENILKLIRIDAVWRFSYLDHKNIQRFGLRAVLQLAF